MSTAPRSLRLAFAGTPRFAVPALDALARSQHLIAAVFTQPDRPAGRGQALQMSAVKRRALELGLAVLQPPSLRTADAESRLRALELDALVVVAYGLILPPPVLAAPRLGCFNIHASLLPRWRGAAPIERALLAGDATTGITIMRMEAGLDTGPLLAIQPLSVAARDTAGTLHDRLAQLGGELIVPTLEGVACGTAHEEPQPQAGVTYAEKIRKSEALIDWRDSAAAVLRRVRAFNPWPVAETKLNGAQLRVWEAELTPADAGRDDARSADARRDDAGRDDARSADARRDDAGRDDARSADARRDDAGRDDARSAHAGAAPGTVIAAGNAGVDVACGRGALRVLRLQLAGRKPLAAREFIKAQPLAGARFASS